MNGTNWYHGDDVFIGWYVEIRSIPWSILWLDLVRTLIRFQGTGDMSPYSSVLLSYRNFVVLILVMYGCTIHISIYKRIDTYFPVIVYATECSLSVLLWSGHANTNCQPMRLIDVFSFLFANTGTRYQRKIYWLYIDIFVQRLQTERKIHLIVFNVHTEPVRSTKYVMAKRVASFLFHIWCPVP